MKRLREATVAENNRNRANFGKSRYRGVSWRAAQACWVAAIKTDGKVTFLGTFKNEEEAARAYDEAAALQHGSFARLNFPQADYEQRIRSALVSHELPSGDTQAGLGATGGLHEPHPDDLAVDRFAVAMKAKLEQKRAEGRGGWENKDECSAELLSSLLIKHVSKGDPVDVANFAMMLHQRGERIAPSGRSYEDGLLAAAISQVKEGNRG